MNDGLKLDGFALSEKDGDVVLDSNPKINKRLIEAFTQIVAAVRKYGLVDIKPDATVSDYASQRLSAEKLADKTANAMEKIGSQLLANDAALLRRAAVLPGGPHPVGWTPEAQLALRQADRTPMSVVSWTAWDDLSGIPVPTLMPFKQALGLASRNLGGSATPLEVVQAVEAAGFFVPPAPNGIKTKSRLRGFVAASQAVGIKPYHADDLTHQPSTVVLKPPLEVSERKIWAVENLPSSSEVKFAKIAADERGQNCGAILWVVG